MTTILPTGNRQTMSSREIAQLCDKKHRHVCRDIDNLNTTYEKMGMPKVGHTPYINPQNGQEYNEFLLTKEQCVDLISGYHTETRIRINRRWQELENNVATLINKTNAETAWLIDDLQDEILRLQPHLLKLITYRKMGLSQREMGLLLGVSDTTIRNYLIKLTRFGLINYTPSEQFVSMGKLGYQAKQQTQLALSLDNTQGATK